MICSWPVTSQSTSVIPRYSVIRKDGLNFVCLYFLKYTWYVNELHIIWKRRSKIFNYVLALRKTCSSVSWEQNVYYASQDFFCVREFIKTEPATAVQRAFRLCFNIQPPTRYSICRWNRQFEQIGCLCKGKSSGRPHVSEENVRWIQESFERSPRKSTRRASRVLGIPQPTVWRVLRRHLLFNWIHLFESPWVHINLTLTEEG